MFFDTEKAYILAEATKTLSLQDDDVHSSEDSLWMGFTTLPRGETVCEHTIDLPPEDVEDGSGPSCSIHVINDFTKDQTFCDRPFVTGHPKLRFYAGVPITTSRNVRIGAFCVLDDKPRDGLDSGQVEFLHQMSTTVMSHLDGLRARAELGRGTNMLTGLGNLVRSSSAGLTGRERLPRRSLQDPEPPTSAKEAMSVTPRLSEKKGEIDAVQTNGGIDMTSKTPTRHGTGASPPAGKILF